MDAGAARWWFLALRRSSAPKFTVASDTASIPLVHTSIERLQAAIDFAWAATQPRASNCRPMTCRL